MGRTGRPPKERGVHSVGDAPILGPVRVLVDTNVAVDAVVRSQERHAIARGFLEALAMNGSTVVFSRLLELEMHQAVRHIAEREAAHPRGAAQRDGRLRRRARTISRTAVRSWTSYLDTVSWVCGELHDAIPSIEPVMYATGLSSYDATMAATAIAHRCDAIASFDSAFGTIHPADVPLLLTAPGRVVHTRRHRATARPI